MSVPIRRSLGTMIVYGSMREDLAGELALASRLGATLLEILPDWNPLPDPRYLRETIQASGFAVHSVHGCWGSRVIRARRVDLADPEPLTRQAGVDDLARCADWLAEVGGHVLVVHPGGLSDEEQFPERREALASSLESLADHVAGTAIRICVENMPPGVHPGTRMSDLATLLDELNRPELALALDTGHAHIAATPAIETLAAGKLLATTHVHDNDGRRDTHDPPGNGSIDWDAWIAALDTIGYHGPIMLECIRYLRRNPNCINDGFLERLDRLTHGGRAG